MRNQSLAISEEDGVGRRLSWFLEKCSTMKQRTALILHCRFYNVLYYAAQTRPLTVQSA